MIVVDDTATLVVPGLWSIPVEIPMVALKVVNVYVFEHPDDGGVTLVDAGWDDDRSLETLRSGLELCGKSIDDVRAVYVTHAHTDHLGLAHRVKAISGAEVVVHEREAERLAGPTALSERFRTRAGDVFPIWGMPTDVTAFTVASERHLDSWRVPVTSVADGEALDIPGWSVKAVWTPGHTPGHLCLYEEDHKLLMTGDHVLPRITPNIGTNPVDMGDTLGDFIQSLHKVAALDVDLVLPGHEHRFNDLSARVDELLSHHIGRLDEVEAAVCDNPGATAWGITQRVHWSRPLETFNFLMIRLAVAETVAHLLHLEALGNACRETVEGVERWSAATSDQEASFTNVTVDTSV